LRYPRTDLLSLLGAVEISDAQAALLGIQMLVGIWRLRRDPRPGG